MNHQKYQESQDLFLFILGLVVNILEPWAFSGLLIGAMLPYWFTAMTMKSVGVAASAIVVEVQRQWRENPRILLDNGDEPDYAECKIHI